MTAEQQRLEELRAELRAERISYGELAELADLAEHIDPSDVELLEAAGVPEQDEERAAFFVKRRARVAYAAMERATREDGTEYIRTRDDAPAWVGEIVHAAHGDMLPDDQRYAMIRDAFDAIADNESDDIDDPHDFADSTTDVYNANLLAWVSSHGSRAGYVDEAREEFGEPRDFYHGLQMGQYAERAEVYSLVLQGLRDSATCAKCGGPAGLICRKCSWRKERAGRLTIRAGARRKRRYLAWVAQPDYLTREHPALLVREASQLAHRLYMVSLGAAR